MPSAFRLRVGNQYFPFSTDAKTAIRSPDETFAGADANDLGKIQNATAALGGETWVINGSIDPQTYALEWPGGTDTPGNRNLPDQPLVANESHFVSTGVADASSAIPTFYYNFADKYDTADLTERNGITDAQKQLVRDIFQLYANYLGVKFVEAYAATVVDGEMTIATGDMAAVGGTSGAGADAGAAFTAQGSGLAVMDGAVNWGTNAYGGAYFDAAMRTISYLLGYGHGEETPQKSLISDISNDPTVNLPTQPAPENILPSGIDIATGQYMYRTDSSAIDLYKFELPTSGTLNLETIAQRMQNSSTLNSYVVLYNAQGQAIARNDDYFGTDSYINMVNLPAGAYYVGVSSTGNDNYNPNVPLSGLNGTSQGPYELRISFAPSPAAPARVLSDGNISLDNSSTVAVTFTAGTAPLKAGVDNGHPVIDASALTSTSLATLDGKTFSIAKGTNTYTFEFVDASNPSRQAATGHLELSFNSQTDTVSSVLQDIAGGINNAVSNLVDTTATPLDGDDDGIPGGQYNFWFNVQNTAHTLYVDKVASASGADGSLAHPFTTIKDALAAAPAPATLQADGNITLDTSTVRFTFAAGTSPLVAGIDSGHPAITGINVGNIPSMAALNHKLFSFTRNNTGVTTTFEFVDVTVAGNKAAAGHQAVYYHSTADTPTTLQAIITEAINGALQPGQIVRIVGNNAANDNSGNTIVAVAANLNTSTPLIQSGQTFTVSDGSQSWVQITPANSTTPSYVWVPDVSTFEFTRATVAAGTKLADGNFAVPIKATDTAQQVATDIANAINAIGVNTTKQTNGLHVSAALVQDATTGQWETVLSGPSVNVDLGAKIQNDPLRSALQDNVAYQIGTDPLGNVLADGATMSVPYGTTLMIDAGTVFKLRNANIDVGSSAATIDRSLGAIQVLGTPSEDAYFTSWSDQRIGSAYYANSQGPAAGDWGGIVYRDDFDYQEQVADPTRKVLEQQGIFLDYVNHANMAYGGGQVTFNGVKDYYDPIYLIQARASITYNTITHSQHAAVSADPNSFQETLFRDSFGEAPFTADYESAGPSIYGNLFTTDTYNGVFIRVATAAGGSQEQLTTDARLTSTDAVYVLAETLSIAGNPGGGIDNVYSTGSPAGLGDNATTILTSAGDGRLGVPMNPATNATFDPTQTGTFFSPATLVTDLESFVLSDTYTSVRFEFDYDASHKASSGSVEISIDPTYSAQQIAAAIAAAINSSGLRISASTIIVAATASSAGAAYVSLSGPTVVVRGLSEVDPRLGGRLKIDPGAIIKASAARIETEVGGEFLAEGTIDRPIIFTSQLDQAYGAGGTFDTANQESTANPRVAAAGDWSGLYFAPTSFGSLDYTRNYYGGGTSAIEGRFAYFAPVEIRQAQVRITNSVFANNNTASTVAAGDDRNGRGDLPNNTVIQIRGAQPILVNDVIANNSNSAAISIDPNSLDSFQVQDWGRSTGPADVFAQYADNLGPMVRQIKTSNNAINGMLVRAGTMLTEGVWDDADIVHVVEGTIVSPNVTIYGGLRLQSNAQESLVVKLLGANAELLSTGTAEDIQGRIGGSLQIIGTPAHPVVLTSLHDNTVGAGFDPWGNPQFDTENAVYNNIHDGTAITLPAPGDWNSLILDSYSNDYNVAEINEYEPAYGAGSTDLNGSIQNSQNLGQLAQSPTGGDDTLRLGFEVHGAVNYDHTADKDVYSFQGTAGTQVWLNIDRTTAALDSQIDLLDANGNVLATAYSSIDPATGNQIMPQFAATGQFAATMDPNPLTVNGMTTSMSDPWYVNNMYSANPNDAAMRVVLPGPAGQQRTYYVRVSSHSGKSSGNYELQIRLQSTRVTPGNVIRYATIDYANNGVEVLGKPDHSPLEVQAYDYIGYSAAVPEVFKNQNVLTQFWDPTKVQSVGNLLASDENNLNVAGYLQDYTDVAWYSFTVNYSNQSGGSTIENGGTTEFPVVFDIGYNSGLARTDAVLWIFNSAGTLLLHGSGSQIADQQTEPLPGANSGNLTHASYSVGDAYVGPVYLPTGNTYYVAITTLEATAKQQTDPLLRWEPVDSINQIADDNIGTQHAATASALSSAPPFVLFPGTAATELNQAAVPFNLGDVPLYILTAQDLYTVNSYTGTQETQVDDGRALPYTNPQAYQSGLDPYVSYGDLLMRNDGRLYGVTQAPGIGAPPTPNGVNQSLWSGTSVQLDTGNASNAPISTQPDGIKTFEVVNGPALEEAGDDKNETGGVAINAATYGPGTLNRNLFFIGDGMQDPANIPYDGGANYHLTNLLYVLTENGVAHDPPGIQNDGSDRLPTQIIPLGQLQTGSAIQGIPATLQGADILDGNQFTVTDNAARTVTFEFDSGPDMDLGKYGSQGVRSGQQFTLTDRNGRSTTFEFVSGPVLIFHNDTNGSLNQATFTITDDKGAVQTFEFVEGGTAPAANFNPITIAPNASAVQVAGAAIAAINGQSFDTKAALGEYGDAADNADPASGSTWARVSLILDSTAVPPTSGNQGGGGANLIQVEGSYNQVNNNAIRIPYKETYADPTFLAIEQKAPAAPASPTETFEGFPWPADFGAQIQAIVQRNMPGITVGYSPAAVAGTVGGDTDLRINFYGAVNTLPGQANFGQATALVHDATTANADFNIRAIDVGGKYNGVVVKIVTGGALNVVYTAGSGGTGGTLTITVTASTTALQVVNAINALAAANNSTFPFTAALDGSREVGGTNNGSGIVKPNATAATTAGGFDNGIMTWTDTTGNTPQVEDLRTAGVSPWGSVWTWRQGVDHLGDAGGLFGPLSGTGAQYLTSTDYLVPFGAGDTAVILAQDMATAINAASLAGRLAARAVAYGPEVDLTNVSNTVLPTAEKPLTITGAGPGGDITGLAYESIDGTAYYFAVSNLGGVYEIANITSPEYKPYPPIPTPPGWQDPPNTLHDLMLTGGGPSMIYLGSITDANGQNVDFQGLTAGPPDVENGAYARTLFAVADDGTLYALAPQYLNTATPSVAQAPIFFQGATSIATGETGATGLAFTTLDYNLWHVTSSRGSAGTQQDPPMDRGHGVNADYDGTRTPTGLTLNGQKVAGGQSFYFGLENTGALPGSANYANTNAGLYNTYNLPDGAAGSLQTQSVDLSNYSLGDQPMLYFNYSLHMAGSATAKVFASADGSNWTELSTQNPLTNTNVNGVIDPDNNWAQREYSLADFVGYSNVRVRFDFTTAGTQDIGDDTLTGSYLSALSGQQLNDGDTFTLTDMNGLTNTFEIDMGMALMVPNAAGDVLQNGEKFTVQSGTGASQTALQTFEFTTQAVAAGAKLTDGNLAIPFVLGETTAQVAQTIVNAVNGAALVNSKGKAILANVSDDRVMLNGAEGVTKSANSTIGTQGLQAIDATRPTDGVVQIFSGDTLVLNVGGKATTFQFTTAATLPKGQNPITFTATDPAAQVAVDIANGINKANIGVTASANGTVVSLFGPAVTLGAGTSLINLLFNGSGTAGTAGDFLIPITSTDSAETVAAEIAAAVGGATSPQIQLRIAVAGANIPDQSTFTVTDQAGTTTTFELTRTNTVIPGAVVVNYLTTDSAAQVAVKIANAMQGAGLSYTAAAVVAQTTSQSGSIVLTGPGLVFNAGTSPLTQTSAQAFTYVRGSLINTAGYTVTDSGILPASDTLLGESDPGNFTNRARGQNNNHEGWYVDDVQIGFAGRGEMATTPATDTAAELRNRDFVFPLAGPVMNGYYTLQIRRAADYGTFSNPTLTITRTFDINDRLSDNVSMTVPDANNISNGETFTISDGVHPLTFQYVAQNVSSPVTNPNYQLIYFTGNETPSQLATATASAINLANSRGMTMVQATAGGGLNSTGGVENGGLQLLALAGANLVDGSTFTISDYVNGTATTFTFSDTAATAAAAATAASTVINYSATDTATQVAKEIADAINAAHLTYTANSLGPTASIRGATLIFTAGTSLLTELEGLYLKAPGAQSIPDQSIFTIVNYTRTITTYELSSSGTAVAGATMIRFLPTDSAVQVAAKIAAAIGGVAQGDTVFFAGAGLAFQRLTSPLIDVSPSDVVADSAVHLFQATNVTTGWTAPTVPASTLRARNVINVNFNYQGDVWNVMDQGQDMIEENSILNSKNYGIYVAGVRPTQLGNANQPAPLGTDPASHPYSVAVMRAVDTNRTVPGITIQNNVLAYGGTGGILFSGNAANGTGTQAAAPFGRIVNNTIYGGVVDANGNLQGTGILVQNNASPTVLNNIFAELATGIRVNAPANDVSNTTVVGYSVYWNNTTNAAGAVATDTDSIPALNATPADQAAVNAIPLFVNAPAGNFYPSQYSPVIDSSVNQLDDRPDMVNVRQPLGIPSSPILTPDIDLYGQLRIADAQVSPYPGLGSNVYKDRGAIDRVDFVGPTSAMAGPQDNDAAGLDIDPRITWVTTTQQQTQFSVQINDSGAGVDSSTVTTANVVLTQDPDNNPADIKTLVDGTDYFFQYDATNHVIHLVPAAGLWAEGYTYNIQLVAPASAAIAAATETGNTVTITTSAAHSFSVGDQVVVAGVGENGYNGTFTITSIPNSTSFTYTNTTTGLAASSGGTVDRSGIQDLAGNAIQPNRLDNTNQFTIVLAGPNGSNSVPAAGIDFSHAIGEPVAWQVEPTAPSVYLGKNPPITQPAYVPSQTRADNDSIDTTKFSLAQGVPVNFPVAVHNGGTSTAYLNVWVDFYGVPATATIAGATETGNTVTITTSAAHNFSVGEQVVVAGVGAGGYNGTFIINTIPTSTTFTYTDPTTGLAASIGGTVVHEGNFTDDGDHVAADVPVAPAATVATATEAGTTVTITTTADHGFSVGEQVAIAGVGAADYNGTVTITSVTDTTFTYTASRTGFPASSGGTATVVSIPITFTVPTSLNPAQPTATIATWLRARLSTQPGLTPTGGMPADSTVAPATAQPDGEVEDFAVSILPPVTVTGTVYNDLNANGTHETAEPGLSGWTVYADIGGPNGTPLGYYVSTDPSATTAADGSYTLNNVPPGAVKIGEIPPTGQSNWYENSPLGGSSFNGFITVNGNPGLTVSGQNFLNYGTMTITGTVWNDLTADGTHDPYEPGLAGWTVYVDLTKVGHYVAGDPTATTAADGTYTIANAPAGVANSLGEVVQTSWAETSPSPNPPANGFLTVTGAQGQTVSGQNFLDSYTVPPAIGSIALLDSTPTNLTTVHYSVTFTEPVTGVDARAFALAATNLTGYSITSVVPTSPAVTFGGTDYYVIYTVTVAAGSVTNAANVGTLKLNGVVDASVVGTNAKSVNSSFAGPAYTIDRVNPLVSSITMTDSPTTTNAQSNTPANSVHYLVAFNELVTGLNANDLVLVAPALVGETISSVSPVGTAVVVNGQNYYTSYTVTANVGTGSGTLRLNLAMSAASNDAIRDEAGNTLPSGVSGSGSSTSNPFIGPVYTIDKVQPTSTIAVAASQPNPAASGPISFTVTFSKPVVGFAAAGVDLSSSTATGAKVQSVSGSGTTWTVTVNGMSVNGNIVARILAGAAHDAAGNATLASASSATIAFVSTPLVTISQAATQPTPVNRGPLVFTVTFNQPIVDFTAAKLSFTGSTAPGKLVATISGKGPTYTVSVTGMTATGLVKLSLPKSMVHNASGVGNSASTGSSNYVFYDIDPATEALSNPVTGSSVLDSTLNTQGYIDVAYSAQTGVGLNTGTITDAGPEFTLSGAGGRGCRRQRRRDAAGRRRVPLHVYGQVRSGPRYREFPRRHVPRQRGQLQQGHVIHLHRGPRRLGQQRFGRQAEIGHGQGRLHRQPVQSAHFRRDRQIQHAQRHEHACRARLPRRQRHADLQARHADYSDRVYFCDWQRDRRVGDRELQTGADLPGWRHAGAEPEHRHRYDRRHDRAAECRIDVRRGADGTAAGRLGHSDGARAGIAVVGILGHQTGQCDRCGVRHTVFQGQLRRPMTWAAWSSGHATRVAAWNELLSPFFFLRFGKAVRPQYVRLSSLTNFGKSASKG